MCSFVYLFGRGEDRDVRGDLRSEGGGSLWDRSRRRREEMCE